MLGPEFGVPGGPKVADEGASGPSDGPLKVPEGPLEFFEGLVGSSFFLPARLRWFAPRWRLSPPRGLPGDITLLFAVTPPP